MRSRTFLKAFGACAATVALAVTPTLPAAAAAQPGGAVAAAASAQSGSTMRLAHTQEIDTLNPFTAVFLVSTQVGRLMYEYLTVSGAESGQPEPGLAESWEASDDDLTWTFTIREGMQWSDGEPITAQDAAFTYNLIMTNEAAAAANGVAVTNYESVTATDDRTLVIKTKQPQASILTSEVPIVPEHKWSGVTDIENFSNSDEFPIVGSGPFVLTGYEEGQSVTLQANDKFWRGRAGVDTLQFVKYENSDAAVQGLIKGDVDIAYNLTPAQFEALQSEDGVTTNEGRNRRFSEILVNPGNPKADGTAFGNGNAVLKDVAVRKALHHAIDVEAIVERVKQGHSEPATSIIPPVFADWHFTPESGQARSYDPAEANRLLDEAGYARGGDGVRLDKAGAPINLRLLARSDETQNQQIAQFVVEWYQEIGIGVTVEIKSSNQGSDDLDAGNYDLAFSGWSVSPDPDSMLAQQTCAVVGTDLSDSNFCDQEYDALYTRQQAELDRDQRKQLVSQMQGILYDNVSAIVLTYDRALEAYRSDRFGGFVTQPADGGVITGQQGYWGYYGAKPAQAAAENGAQGGTTEDSNTPLIVGGVIGGIAVLALVVWGVTRRRGTADDRE